MDRIPLSQLIEVVSAELRKAESQASRRTDHIMQFEECELEMAVEVETGGQGELNIWVFKLGGDRKKTDSNTIRVKFKRLQDVSLAFPAQTEQEPGPELGYDEGGK